MELRSIELFNFRQFEAVGENAQKIEFARAGERNVTAIYGTNGAGKSGLLNAFTWALFGKTTKALKHPWSLVNQTSISRATRGEAVPARVCIEFDTVRSGSRILHRIQRETLVTAGSAVIPADPDSAPAPHGRATLWIVEPSTGMKKYEDQEEIAAYINAQVLPSELFQYFFIDGERIAQLAQPENERDVRNAIELFVGLRELEEGAKHLKQAANSFDTELAKHERTNKALQDLDRDIATKEKEEERISADVEQVQDTIDELEKELHAISEELERNRSTSLLEEQRKNVQLQIQTRKDEFATAESNLFGVAIQNGWTAFALDVACKHLGANIDFRKRGELPYNIRRPFIEELLQRRECLCGRTLDDTCAPKEREDEINRALKRLEQELLRTDFSEIQSDLFGATMAMRQVSEIRSNLLDSIAQYDNQIKDAQGRISDLERTLSDLNSKLEGAADIDAKGLPRRRDLLEEQRREAIGKQALLRGRLDENAKLLVGLRAQRAQLALTTDAGRCARARADLCRSVAKAMEDFRQLERRNVRMSMERRLREIFRSYSITGYQPRMSENYALTLHKKFGEIEELVADSTGEGQALSLAFITAVTQFAVRHRNDRAFPIIIDSQFGSLDRNYHRRIAEILPASIGQVVMMQTKTQWTDEMTSAMRPRIGRQVVLTRRVTGASGVLEDGRFIDPSESLDLDSGVWSYVEAGDSDSTLIRQIPSR